MGAHRLWLWSEKDGAAQPQAYRALEDAVAGLGGGGEQQRWSAVVAVHRRSAHDGARATNQAQDLHLVSLSEAPEQLYLVARAERKLLEANASAKPLLDSYGASGKQRAALQLEGTAHNAGDFRITLARATSRPANDFRGLVVVAEWLPAADVSAAAPRLAELGELLQEAAQAAAPAASLRQVEETHAEYGLPVDVFAGTHLAAALVQLMHQDR